MATKATATVKEETKVAKEEAPSFEEDVTTILTHLLQPSSEETTAASTAALGRLQSDYAKVDDEG